MQQALDYLETHLNIYKELNNEENASNIERMQAEYAFRKEKEALEYIDQRKDKNKYEFMVVKITVWE